MYYSNKNDSISISKDHSDNYKETIQKNADKLNTMKLWGTYTLQTYKTFLKHCFVYLDIYSPTGSLISAQSGRVNHAKSAWTFKEVHYIYNIIYIWSNKSGSEPISIGNLIYSTQSVDRSWRRDSSAQMPPGPTVRIGKCLNVQFLRSTVKPPVKPLNETELPIGSRFRNHQDQ